MNATYILSSEQTQASTDYSRQEKMLITSEVGPLVKTGTAHTRIL